MLRQKVKELCESINLEKPIDTQVLMERFNGDSKLYYSTLKWLHDKTLNQTMPQIANSIDRKDLNQLSNNIQIL